MGGNTDLLLQSMLKGITDESGQVDFIKLSNLNLNPCFNCGGCNAKGECIQNDDMQELYDKLVTYELIILASPIYFMNVSAWTKKMIDRCQALWVRKYRLDKLPTLSREKRKGFFISVSGMTKPHVFDPAKKTVQSFFATINVTYVGNLLFSGIDSKGDIERHPSALSEAEALGRKLIIEIDNPKFKFAKDGQSTDIEHDRK